MKKVLTLSFMLQVLILTASMNLFAIPFAPKSGEQIFKSQCSACHTSAALNQDYPIIHGQSPQFLFKELLSFKEDLRMDYQLKYMNYISKQLTDEELQNVSMYISSLSLCDYAPSTLDAKGGNPEKGLQLAQQLSCINCHQKGNTNNAPVLDGQKTNYMVYQLNLFKNTVRKSQFMNGVVEQLSDKDVLDVSAYFNSIQSCH